MDQDLIKLIERAGFTEKEARIYLALLELSRATVTQIAKVTQLKRSIIYVILEGLIKRDFVSEIPHQKINTYQSVDPAMILGQLKRTTQDFSEMMPLLQTLRNRGENKPKITYLETKEGILNVYEEMNVSPEAFFITSLKRIEETFPEIITDWVKTYKKGLYKVQGFHLLSDDPEETQLGKKLKEASQKVRITNKLRDNSMDFAIFGKKLAITSFEENYFMVVLESESLVKSMRAVFEIVWEQGKEI